MSEETVLMTVMSDDNKQVERRRLCSCVNEGFLAKTNADITTPGGPLIRLLVSSRVNTHHHNDIDVADKY